MLHVHKQLLLQSGKIAKSFQEQPASKTHIGSNTGLGGEGEQRADLTSLLATLICCFFTFLLPGLLTPPQRYSLGLDRTTELLARGRSPCWRLEGQLLPISQYSMLQRAVAKLGRLTIPFARALAPFQAILSGLIVW